jgi:hypothetical protein
MPKRHDRHTKPLVVRPTASFTYIEIDPKVMCPFCLYQSTLSHFGTKTSKGKESKMFKCPDCGQGMRQDTLTKDMTTKQFAEWVWEYRSFGFWQMINFAKFSERLKNLGIAREFWDEYKRLKENGVPYPSYTKWLEETQKEQHEKELRGEE